MSPTFPVVLGAMVAIRLAAIFAAARPDELSARVERCRELVQALTELCTTA